MVTLILDRLWINLVATGEGISGVSNRDKTQGFSIESRVSTYASGRRRAISTVGERGSLPFALRSVTLTTKDQLRGWLGRQVQVRDIRGQKWFGIFAELGVTETMYPNEYEVSFTLELTTTVEGV